MEMMTTMAKESVNTHASCLDFDIQPGGVVRGSRHRSLRCVWELAFYSAWGMKALDSRGRKPLDVK